MALESEEEEDAGGHRNHRESRVASRDSAGPITEFVCFSNTFDVNTEHVSGLDFNAVCVCRITAVARELSKPNSSDSIKLALLQRNRWGRLRAHINTHRTHGVFIRFVIYLH